MNDVSLVRLCILRALYLFVVVGLGAVVWPDVLAGLSHAGVLEGEVSCMLAGFSLMCLMGLRYPLQMLPVLLWEVTWKTLWLVLLPLPQFLAGHVDERYQAALFAISMVVLVYAAIHWGYMVERFVRAGGERWLPARSGVRV
jgi:hypothetical protein